MKAANTLKKSLTMNSRATATLECIGPNALDISILITIDE